MIREMIMNKWEDQELARFSKNSCEDVRLTLQRRALGKYLDIRIWTKIGPGDGAPSNPTELGLMVDVDLLPDLRRAIDQAIDALGGEALPAESKREDRELIVKGERPS